ncbi:MAG: hypothetical protein N2440_01835 [Actinobacteria bacterium]|nr:hypothetical protein [Actinomycetota bacterium]
MRSSIYRFFALIIIAASLFAAFIAINSLSEDKKPQQKKHTETDDVLIEDAKLVYKTLQKSSKRKILVLESKDNVLEVKARYTILASEKGWNLVSEIPIKDGLMLIFSGDKETVDISIRGVEEGTKIIVSISQD